MLRDDYEITAENFAYALKVLAQVYMAGGKAD